MEPGTSTLLQSLYLLVLGAGIGLTMQVLVLVVQNTVDFTDLGVATSGVTFFRTIGSSLSAQRFSARCSPTSSAIGFRPRWRAVERRRRRRDLAASPASAATRRRRPDHQRLRRLAEPGVPLRGALRRRRIRSGPVPQAGSAARRGGQRQHRHGRGIRDAHHRVSGETSRGRRRPTAAAHPRHRLRSVGQLPAQPPRPCRRCGRYCGSTGTPRSPAKPISTRSPNTTRYAPSSAADVRPTGGRRLRHGCWWPVRPHPSRGIRGQLRPRRDRELDHRNPVQVNGVRGKPGADTGAGRTGTGGSRRAARARRIRKSRRDR